MFVKKIEIFGFKTFAEKTEVELSKGLTVIVGPNGCGKTNITDALMWVLGESNVRNIRAQKTTDVIFSGSQKRKALGLAEVSITFDNTCGTLPLSFGEVTVTRRAFRSGESEFFINKSRCRLKDIYELFLDTGIGREAYSTVSQGEIDAVLSAKPEDRRELLEEAAGVKKYRYRRQEALRKLEKTEANLHRVKDIMTELEEQLEPISTQAEQAKRYLELEKQLQEVEVGLLIRDLHRFQIQLDSASKAKDEADRLLEECDTELTELEQTRVSRVGVLSQMEEGVDQARQVVQSLGVGVQKLDGRVALIREKLRGASSVRDRATIEIETLAKRVDELKTRIESARTEGVGVLQAESEAQAEVAAAVAEMNEATVKLQTETKFVQDSKASYLELARELAAKRTSLQNSRERAGQFEESSKRIVAQVETLNNQKLEVEIEQESAQQGIATLQARIQESIDSTAKLTESRKDFEKKASDVARQQSDISRDTASRSSRLAALSEMAQAHEGFFEGVRSVMNARKSGRIDGEFAVVADVIGVPKGLETAIEIALGANLQDIITDTVEQAKSAISYLKQERAGRATFLPLDNIRQDNRQVQGRMSKSDGVLGIASDLLDFDSRYTPAIESLLGRCVVVEDIDCAVDISRVLSGWNRIVTLEGDIILPSGAVTGGAVKSKGPGLLVRKSEMESLAVEVKDLKKRAADAQAESVKLQEEIVELTAQLKSVQASADEDRVSLADCKRRLQHSEGDITRLSRQIQALQMESVEAEKLQSREQGRISELESELQVAGETNLDIDKAVTEAEARISVLEEERSKLRERVLQLNVNLASAAERSVSIKSTLSETNDSLKRAKDEMESRSRELTQSESEFVRLSSEETLTVEEHKRQSELLVAAKKTLDERAVERSQEAEHAAEVDSAIRKLMTKKAEASSSAHEAELKQARLDVQSSQILERLLTEYEIDTERALAWPVDEIEVERGVASEVARIRREMRDMGQVNTGAVQEYERVSERWEFLSAQRADLEQAESQIQAAISEIDINTRDLFMNTYAAVAANFDLMFKQLFNGGKTELSLTLPNNLLDTGIEIAIQPPGKKLQDMSLLSGGERALTATAFVFALLLAKPSPFVVMDEVDAPLDESNVERFAEVLKQFSERSQFIVITHNRSTMEAADYLYGVTMQEPGISKLISVRLTGESAERQEPAYTS